MGRSVGVRRAVCGVGSEGISFGWRQRCRQLGRQSRSRQRLLASARELTSGTAAGEGVDVGESVSEGVGVRDGRGGSVMCVVGGSKGVGGVWLEAVRVLAASGIHWRWPQRQRQRGRWRRLVYSGDGGRKGVGGVRGGSGDSNGRRGQHPVRGGAYGGVRDNGGVPR